MPELFVSTLFNYSKSILPWFAIGVVVAFLVEKHVRPKVIGKYFGNTNFLEIIFALLLGMISPLSIMSFLPVASEFVSLGFNSGLLFAFLVAERAYDLQSFFIVTSLFGIKVAILNALAILISLIGVAYTLRKNLVSFAVPDKKHANNFWQRQLKILVIVVLGILVGAALRVLIPQHQFQDLAASAIGGLVTSIVLGFTLYFGPILGNYPVAKAFFDLGMSSQGVLGFLTISPVFNLVIIVLFGSAVGFKTTLKAVGVYTTIAVVLTLVFSLLI